MLLTQRGDWYRVSVTTESDQVAFKKFLIYLENPTSGKRFRDVILVIHSETVSNACMYNSTSRSALGNHISRKLGFKALTIKELGLSCKNQFSCEKNHLTS